MLVTFSIHITAFVLLLDMTTCPHNGTNYNPWFVTHSFRAHFLDSFSNKHRWYPHFWNSAILVQSAHIFHLESKTLRLGVPASPSWSNFGSVYRSAGSLWSLFFLLLFIIGRMVTARHSGQTLSWLVVRGDKAASISVQQLLCACPVMLLSWLYPAFLGCDCSELCSQWCCWMTVCSVSAS